MDIYLIHQTVEMIQIQVLSQASIFQKVPNNWFVLGTVPKRSLSFAVNILILITQTHTASAAEHPEDLLITICREDAFYNLYNSTITGQKHTVH